MFKTTIVRIAVVIACLSILSATASADTKVKTRQTTGGQTYENTSYIKGKRQRTDSMMGGRASALIIDIDNMRFIELDDKKKTATVTPLPCAVSQATSAPIFKRCHALPAYGSFGENWTESAKSSSANLR